MLWHESSLVLVATKHNTHVPCGHSGVVKEPHFTSHDDLREKTRSEQITFLEDSKPLK